MRGLEVGVNTLGGGCALQCEVLFLPRRERCACAGQKRKNGRTAVFHGEAARRVAHMDVRHEKTRLRGFDLLESWCPGEDSNLHGFTR